MLPTPVLDLEHEVSRGIEARLDGCVALARVDEAGGEEVAGARVLEADLAAVAAGHDADPAGPDLVGLEPLAALVATGGGARRDLVDGDLAHHQECVLEGLLFLHLKRHRFGERESECVGGKWEFEFGGEFNVNLDGVGVFWSLVRGRDVGSKESVLCCVFLNS